MDFKLIVLDLDGTLTNSKKIITGKTKNALMKAQKCGIKVVLASGRPTFGIMPLVKELELEKFGGFVLSYNGGQIIDIANQKTVYQQMMPAHTIPLLYAEALKRNLAIMSYRGNDVITETPDDQWVNIEARINHMPVKKVDSFVETITYPVPKCLIVGEPDYLGKQVTAIQQIFGDELSIYRSAAYFLECVPPGIDKAKSLQRLLDYLHLDKKEMIAFGDGFNDESMIKFAGMGIAMGNAETEVQGVSNYITVDNDHDGVAYAINKFVFHHNVLKRMMHTNFWRLKWQQHKRRNQKMA